MEFALFCKLVIFMVAVFPTIVISELFSAGNGQSYWNGKWLVAPKDGAKTLRENNNELIGYRIIKKLSPAEQKKAEAAKLRFEESMRVMNANLDTMNQNLANMGQNIGQNMANMGQNMANMGQNIGQNIGQNMANIGQNIGQNMANMGQNMFNGRNMFNGGNMFTHGNMFNNGQNMPNMFKTNQINYYTEKDSDEDTNENTEENTDEDTNENTDEDTNENTEEDTNEDTVEDMNTKKGRINGQNKFKSGGNNVSSFNVNSNNYNNFNTKHVGKGAVIKKLGNYSEEDSDEEMNTKKGRQNNKINKGKDNTKKMSESDYSYSDNVVKKNVVPVQNNVNRNNSGKGTASNKVGKQITNNKPV